MKKLMSILIAGAMISTMAVSAFAYDTDVTYSTTLDQGVDANGDGEIDGTVTDDTPYLLVVPEDLEVDGETKSVYIAGIVDTPVRVTVPSSATMNDEVGNTMSANITLLGGELVLPVSLTHVGTANSSVSAHWMSAPLTGSWTGNFEYTVS